MPVAATAGGIAGTSSGEATSSAASTPFSLPEGSGAFKHACIQCQWGNEDEDPTKASYLDQVLAFGLCDQRLKLGSGEGVDKTGFGDDQQENLCASKDGQFVCLDHD